jgi:hypothetical protein
MYTLVFKGSFPSISRIFILHPPFSSAREAVLVQEPNPLTNAPRRSGWGLGVCYSGHVWYRQVGHGHRG